MAPLSVKHAATFQSALQNYEKKKYKESLKDVEEILKRRKDHGESLCLRGLLWHHLDTGEPLQSIQEGLKCSPDSSVAWHMAGIYYKAVKDYPEAYKAFGMSFKLNKENPSVQHDLSMLAMQLRDYPQLVEVRQQMLAAKPSVKMVWVGLAVAHFLNKNYKQSLKTLDLYDNLMASDYAANTGKTATEKRQADVEVSELLLFRNEVVRKALGAKSALLHLKASESKIWDALSVSERRAALLKEAGDIDGARQAYEDLIHRNPANKNYYDAVQDLSDGKSQIDFWRAQSRSLPGYGVAEMQLITCLASDPASEEQFVAQLRKMLKHWLIVKQTPASFEFIKPFYENPGFEVVEKALEGLELNTENTVHQVFRARHMAYSGDLAKSLELIKSLPEDNADVALAHGKILQLCGDYVGAAKVMSKASSADLGDRFMNTKATKYALRAGLVDEAITLATRFPMEGDKTKTERTALRHLIDLESVNFVTRLSRSYQRIHDHGMAFKYAITVMDIFKSYHSDQFDFHYYGIRRGTITAYLNLVSWEDNLWSNPRFSEALKIAIEEAVYTISGDVDGTTEKQRESAKRKRAKQLPIDGDQDPFGIDMLENKDVLDKVFAYWKLLEKVSSHEPETWRLVFEIYLAQKKYVLAVQALKRAKELGSSKEWVAAAGLRARHTLESDQDAPDILRKLQLKMLPTIVTDGDIVNDSLRNYADQYVKSPGSYWLWVNTRRLIDAKNLEDVENELAAKVASLSVAEAEEVLIELRKAQSGDKFVVAVRGRYPLSSFI